MVAAHDLFAEISGSTLVMNRRLRTLARVGVLDGNRACVFL